MVSHDELLDNLFDGVYYVDKDRQISYWNKGAERITGFSSSEVLGFSCANNILRHIDAAGNELCQKGCPLLDTLQDGQMREAEVFLHHRNGHRVPVHIRVSPIKNDAGEIIGGLEVFSDNSQQLALRQKLDQLEDENMLDPLLQIGNRRLAEQVFETGLYELNAFQTPFALAMIDVDQFKQINDSWGHSLGDQVLLMIARSIQNVLRGKDTLIRWGGDEIAVLLPNVTRSGLEEILERIRMIVDHSFLMHEGKKITVSASIGGTMAEADDSLESIIARADQLMYASKAQGRNTVTVG